MPPSQEFKRWVCFTGYLPHAPSQTSAISAISAMAQIPSPVPTPSSGRTPSEPQFDPIARLDALLEIYLSHVDAYTTLRSQLSQQFRAGFFSLAQAQRASTLGPGRRYGEESYDERMKAVRRVKIVHKLEREEETPEDQDEGDDKSVEVTALSFVVEDHQPPSNNPSACEEIIKDAEPQSETNPKIKSKRYDPLHQFGVFVPPALRQCQSSFTTALSSIPALVNTALQLSRLEGQIESARQELGLGMEGGGGSAGEPEETEPEAVRTGDEDEVEKLPTRTISSPLKSTLASRAKEPRSRVLKLD